MKLKQLIRKISPFAFLKPEGDKGINKIGHRDYIGGKWEQIGRLQFVFLKSKGLKPDSYLLDIGCGSLRLGVKAIAYLEPEHYLGIEKEKSLVKAGLEKECSPEMVADKKPNIIISEAFEFEKLKQKADFAMAHSLFTHMPPELINKCFKNLNPNLSDNGVFYATYFKSEEKRNNPDQPHDHGHFAYTQREMSEFGVTNGFRVNYIGDFKHPRKQVIVEYTKIKMVEKPDDGVIWE